MVHIYIAYDKVPKTLAQIAYFFLHSTIKVMLLIIMELSSHHPLHRICDQLVLHELLIAGTCKVISLRVLHNDQNHLLKTDLFFLTNVMAILLSLAHH